MTERREIAYAVEVFLDFIQTATDGKDDDEPVSIEPEVRALAQACGVEWDEELGIESAGEIRTRCRAAKAALSAGHGP